MNLVALTHIKHGGKRVAEGDVFDGDQYLIDAGLAAKSGGKGKSKAKLESDNHQPGDDADAASEPLPTLPDQAA